MISVLSSDNSSRSWVLRNVGKLLLDRLGFVTGPDKTEEEVVRVPNVLETPIVWVVEHARRELLRLLSQNAAFLRAPRASQITGAIKQYS